MKLQHMNIIMPNKKEMVLKTEEGRIQRKVDEDKKIHEFLSRIPNLIEQQTVYGFARLEIHVQKEEIKLRSLLEELVTAAGYSYREEKRNYMIAVFIGWE